MLTELIIWFDDHLIINVGILAVAITTILITSKALRKSDAPPASAPALAPSSEPAATLHPATGDKHPAESAHPAAPIGLDPDYNPARNHEQARALIQSIQGDPPRRHFSIFYTAGLFIVALGMLLLPCIYLAFIGGIGYGVYWYAIEQRDILHGGSGAVFRMLLYCGPLIIGSILTLFLLEPLFARRRDTVDPVTIEEHDEPVLHAFIQELCLTLGAPMPRQIEVVCDANAAASFRHGLWSIFRRGDVVLTIGLPLAAGMTLQGFAGVLAHEFGHFTQGTAMRLNAIIRHINGWFAQLVYGESGWERTVCQTIDEANNGWIQIICYLILLSMKLSRGLLWLLMMTGHAMSCFLMRQQEYDADRYEAFLVGAKGFIEASNRILTLSVAAESAYSALELGLQKMTLPDNFTKLCMHIHGQLPHELYDAIRMDVMSRETRLLDTHPSGHDRAQAVTRAKFPGTFHPPTAPASVLFRNFTNLNHMATMNLYRQRLGSLVDHRITIPTNDFLDRLDEWQQQPPDTTD